MWQRALFLASVGIVLVFTQSVRPDGINLLEPLFLVESFAPPHGSFGAALAVAPGSPEIILATVGGGFGTDQEVWRIDITDPESPVFTLLVGGAYDLSAYPGFVDGDDVLDSLFGSVGGLAMLPTGELIIVDNNERAFEIPPIPGDTIYIARDLSGDGDFRDVVAGTPEVTELVSPIPGVPSGSGWGGFSGVQAEVGPDGAVCVITSDGLDAAEIVRITDPAGSASAEIFFSGLDYGSGLAWIGDDLFAGDVDDTFGFARLWSLNDADADGNALASGESTVVTGSLAGVWDLAAGPDATLWQTQFTTLDEIDPSTGASLRTLAAPSGFGSFGDLVFTSIAGSFEPGGIDRATLVTTTNDFAGTTFVHLITPSQDDTTAVSGYELYQ